MRTVVIALLVVSCAPAPAPPPPAAPAQDTVESLSHRIGFLLTQVDRERGNAAQCQQAKRTVQLESDSKSAKIAELESALVAARAENEELTRQVAEAESKLQVRTQQVAKSIAGSGHCRSDVARLTEERDAFLVRLADHGILDIGAKK